MWHRWASSAGPPASTGAGAEGSSGGTWHHCIKIGKRWKKTEGDVMKVDGDGWRAFQKSWAFPHRSPFWSKFIYKIVDFEHFSMLFIEGSRSIYDMRFQSWPATKWLLKFKNTPKESWTGSDEGFLWFPVFFAWRPHMSCVPMSWTIHFWCCHSYSSIVFCVSTCPAIGRQHWAFSASTEPFPSSWAGSCVTWQHSRERNRWTALPPSEKISHRGPSTIWDSQSASLQEDCSTHKYCIKG